MAAQELHLRENPPKVSGLQQLFHKILPPSILMRPKILPILSIPLGAAQDSVRLPGIDSNLEWPRGKHEILFISALFRRSNILGKVSRFPEVGEASPRLTS
jgi:hypothetical protein